MGRTPIDVAQGSGGGRGGARSQEIVGLLKSPAVSR
jgi:hypothetical protein